MSVYTRTKGVGVGVAWGKARQVMQLRGLVCTSRFAGCAKPGRDSHRLILRYSKRALVVMPHRRAPSTCADAANAMAAVRSGHGQLQSHWRRNVQRKTPAYTQTPQFAAMRSN